jgi:peptide chain release factor 2
MKICCQQQESIFDPASMEKESQRLTEESNRPGFWDKQKEAQELLKKKKDIDETLEEYYGLENDFKELKELKEIADELEDEDEADKILEAFDKLCDKTEDFHLKTLLNGKYDHASAILTIHAGAGGVDAMDWAEMLLRMYDRWSEGRGYSVKVADIQYGGEAGIKSATLMIGGINAYGYLKKETGVHRIVRISPFNAAGKRQTSFASVDVMPEIDDDIEVKIDPSDLKIDTYRSTGAGGQHVNTTDSAVRITHLPTNIVVTCQNERSQIQNREVAMRILKSRLTELAEREKKESLEELKGDYSQITWGSQIRSYVFQPYTMVKDHRTGKEVGNVQAVMDGEIDPFIRAELYMETA